MADQQPWGGTPDPGQQAQNQYGQHAQQADQGQWAQGPQHAAPQQKGSGLDALRPFFTPLYVAGASGVLFLLTLLGYWLSWKGVSEDGSKGTVNGFGIQKMTEDGESARAVVMGFFSLGSTVLFLLIAAVVLAATTMYQKVAALCLTAAGVIGLVYTVISMFTDFGMDKKFLGMDFSSTDGSIDWSLKFGIILALVIGLVTLAFGVLYFLSVQGPLLPASAPSARVTGLAAVFRPVYFAGATVVLFLLLLLSYLLEWRSVKETEDGEKYTVAVNGFGGRDLTISGGYIDMAFSDVSLFGLFAATLMFLLVAGGALVIGMTTWKKIGGLLVAAGAALALLTSFIGLVTDYGIFREFGGEDLGSGYTPSTSVSFGVFLALFFSLVLLVVAVLYLLVDFGIIGGAKPQQPFGQQFGQAPQGRPGQPQWNQYGQAPQQPQQGQQYPPQDPGQNPGQIPQAPGRW